MKNVLTWAVIASMTMSSIFPMDTSINRTNQIDPIANVTDADGVVKKNLRTLKDGINEGWKIDSVTQKGGEIVEVRDGMLHLKAGSSNGNSVSDANKYPAVFVNDSTLDFTKPGFFSTKMISTQGVTKDRFGFYIGYNGPGNGLFLGYDAGGWFWQKYQDGNGPWYEGTRVAGPVAGQEYIVKIEWNEQKRAKLIVNNQAVFEDLDFTGMKLSNKIGIKAGTYGADLTEVKLKGMDYTGLNAPVVKYAIRGTVTDDGGQPIVGADAHIGDMVVTTDATGAYSFAKEFSAGEYTLRITKPGYQDVSQTVTVVDADILVGAIKLTPASIATEIIQSADMQVEVYKNFPSVRKYVMTKMGNKDLYGQITNTRTIAINGQNIDLDASAVTYKRVSDSEVLYTLVVQQTASNIDAIVTASMIVDGNKLHVNITKIENKAGDSYPVQTIAFPNQSLISINSNESGASFTGAVMSSDVNKTGDETVKVTKTMGTMRNKDYMYGFLSNDSISAGIWSNSEHDGRAVASVAGGGKNTRIFANTTTQGDVVSLGLSSAPWYYQRTVRDSRGKSYTINETDMPKMSIVITGDENQDSIVNWQDGAIAYRGIMNNPYKSEEVPELVAYRIAMNFGSQAQNPFLTTLDNVKRVALITDGLGQSVLLKGYGNEGHDSGHPDYGDIGKRIGGAKDFTTLMEKGKAYGARFGVHVNASEMYPEAKAFTEKLIRRNASGGLHYGWNWLDQGVGIDGIYDLATGSRQSRYADLKKQVSDHLDFIYLDVWGNQTSGVEDSWETRKMSKMINDAGWRMTNEWGAANEYDSTFQHWAADLTYGGSTMKGINSQVMRFLRNHQKDSWNGDYPRYGGASIAPLLGGYNMKDFEGWQGRNDYDAYINNLYTHDLSTKFLQHFKITSWLNNPLDATAPMDANINDGNEQITLKDDANNIVVIARKSNVLTDAAYRNRTITLNNKVISTGSVSKGDGSGKGDETYVLPWNWDVNTGVPLANSDEKLYHWNTRGGSTTWDLPNSWKGETSVKVYQLTDLGKADEKDVAVNGGQITLTATAETPYVITKGKKSPIQVTWSEGMHIVDAGFNSGEAGLASYWNTTGSGTASIAMSQFSNPMVKLSNDVAITQTITGLEAGKKYAMYIGVDNRSEDNASAIISSNGKEIGKNYTGASIARNYVKAYAHSTSAATVHGSSYFQNMYVFFTAPQDGSDVAITLQHEGEGDAYFDDVRIVENGSNNTLLDEEGNLKLFTNDFEQNAQGIYPFVVGGSEGVEDNRIHLSELHAPYTQHGWDVKKMDDVLEGDWSVKINGLVQKNTLIYQTVPQNIHFTPGAKYKVSFQYQSGSDETYALAIGSGEYNASSIKLQPLKKAIGESTTYEFEMIGALAGDSWFGIYSTATAPDLQGATGNAADFGGYKDFILDNLKVEQLQETFTKEDAEKKLEELSDPTKYPQANYSMDAWKTYTTTLVEAKVLLNKDHATSSDYHKAFILLRSLESYMETAPGSENDDFYDVNKDSYHVKAGSEQPVTGSEGPALFAQDGNPDTWWHTRWGDTNLDNAWYEIELKEPTTIDGLRYLPRPGSATTNGKIKDYAITLTVMNKNSKALRDVNISGTFDTVTKWQKKSFAAVENVVKLRLKVNTSSGASASQENRFASASALYVTTPKSIQADKVDKTGLDLVIKSVGNLQQKDYTIASWKFLQEKLAAANSVFLDEKASAYDVALATTNLKGAIEKLETLAPSVDLTNLNVAISNAQNIDTSNYTDESVEALKKALAHALVVQSNNNVTQAEVDNATTLLYKAIQELKLKPGISIDRTVLMNKLNEAIKVNKNIYTNASYQKLLKAIEYAQAILGNPKASQIEIENAYFGLEKAMLELVPIASGSKPEANGNVNTGDSVNKSILFITFLLAGGIVLCVFRQRRNVNSRK